MTTLTHASFPLLTALAWLTHSPLAHAQNAEPASREARVVFETSPEHLGLYRTSFRSTAWASAGRYSASGEERNFQRVCVAPCEAVLPAGTDTYAVSRTDGHIEQEPKPIGTLTLPPGASTVRIEYRDRRTVRVIGDLVGFGVGIGGIVYAAVELLRFRSCDDEVCKKSHLTGAAIGGGFFVGGLSLTVVANRISDEVDVQVTPRPSPTGMQLPRARQLALRGSF